MDADKQVLQDEYSMMANRHFIGIHGYMLVYSIGSKQSFEMMTIIRDKILNHLVSQQSIRCGPRLRVLVLTSVLREPILFL